jgi:hypothetical protein
MARWADTKEAIEAGRTSDLTRVKRGIPIMLKYSDLLERERHAVPFGLLIVKGAFESKGNPSAKSAVDEKGRQAIGLFQLYTGVQGYSTSQLMNPTTNTRAFVYLMEDRARKLHQTHGSYFKAGQDYEFWCMVLLTSMIGPGATRALMESAGAGEGMFTRVVNWTRNHPVGLYALEDSFGVQGAELVAFRVMVTYQMAHMATAIRPVGGQGDGVALMIAALLLLILL